MKGIAYKKGESWFVKYKKTSSKTISEVNCLAELWETIELPLQSDNSALTENQEVEFDIVFTNSHGSISKVGGYGFDNLVAILKKELPTIAYQYCQSECLVDSFGKADSNYQKAILEFAITQLQDIRKGTDISISLDQRLKELKIELNNLL